MDLRELDGLVRIYLDEAVEADREGRPQLMRTSLINARESIRDFLRGIDAVTEEPAVKEETIEPVGHCVPDQVHERPEAKEEKSEVLGNDEKAQADAADG